MARLLFISLILFTITSEIRSQTLWDYNVNIQVNTRGYGANLSMIEQTNSKLANALDFGFTVLKDPQEIRITNLTIANAGVFFYGKINSIACLRAGYGKEITLAKRPDRNTVGIIWSSVAGINLALQSPIFIDHLVSGNTNETVRYNPAIHSRDNIIQSRGFFKGLSQAEYLPGIYLKQGIVFEFGNFNYAPNRVESGVLLDALFIRPEIMYSKKHAPVFLSFYFSFAILNFN